MNDKPNVRAYRRLLALLVFLPMLGSGIYYGYFAQDRYVSTSIITVRRANQDSVATGGLAMLIAGAGGNAHEDTRVLRDYVHSLGLMKKLDASLSLREHFESASTDPFFRLWPQASQEWMLEYWRSRVDVQLDEVTGLVTMRVEGFDPVFAQRLNQALLSECEAFVNEVSQRMAREQVGFAQGELDRAEQKLQVERSAMMKFQTVNQMIDPLAQAQATGALTAELRGQLAKVEAEMSAKRAYLKDDASELVSLKNQRAALRLQVSRESRGATQGGRAALNGLAIEFHELKTRAGFAEDAYRAALMAVESTRVETARKVKGLVVVEAPTLAERAEYPRRVYNLITVLTVGLLLYAVARLAVATVNEHRD